MTTCETCGCPALSAREACAWCGASLHRDAPVAFVLRETEDRFEWRADDTVVAAATRVHGLWRIVDAHDRHVVTLMPVGGEVAVGGLDTLDGTTIDATAFLPGGGFDGPEASEASLQGALAPATALVGPRARLLGTVVHEEDESGRPGVSIRDETDRAVLVLRGDGPTGSHVVDRSGEVVALSSWSDEDHVTDVLVTSSGTRQPLALVFGLLLATELERQPGRQQA